MQINTCTCHHCLPRLSRRSLLKTLGASLLLAPILGKTQPAQAARQTAQALVLSCIDFRFIGAEQIFLTNTMAGAYDWVALAGASLALKGFPHAAEAETFWDQLALSRKLHHIQKVVILDHQDCGAYATYFKTEFSQDSPQEYELHQRYLQQAKDAIHDRYPTLITEGYFVDLMGQVVQIV